MSDSRLAAQFSRHRSVSAAHLSELCCALYTIGITYVEHPQEASEPYSRHEP